MLGAVPAAQVMLIEVLLLMPPALAETEAVVAVLPALKVAEAFPPWVVTEVGETVPPVAVSVTAVPSATGDPLACPTPMMIAVVPPQLSEGPPDLISTCDAGPATGVATYEAWAHNVAL